MRIINYTSIGHVREGFVDQFECSRAIGMQERM